MSKYKAALAYITNYIDDVSPEPMNFKDELNNLNELVQRAVKKKPLKVSNYSTGITVIKCPICKQELSINKKYCDECGQALDMSDYYEYI